MGLLVSPSDCSLLVFIKATVFWILILYLVALLNYSNSYLVEYLGFSKYSMSSMNSDTFASLFPIWVPCSSFSFLIVVVKTSDNMLKKSGESGYLSLVPALWENAFNFSTLSMMLSQGLPYTDFIMLRYTHPFCFYHKCQISSNAFYASRWSYDFYL